MQPGVRNLAGIKVCRFACLCGVCMAVSVDVCSTEPKVAVTHTVIAAEQGVTLALARGLQGASSELKGAGPAKLLHNKLFQVLRVNPVLRVLQMNHPDDEQLR